jgi:hypothetical protein
MRALFIASPLPRAAAVSRWLSGALTKTAKSQHFCLREKLVPGKISRKKTGTRKKRALCSVLCSGRNSVESSLWIHWLVAGTNRYQAPGERISAKVFDTLLPSCLGRVSHRDRTASIERPKTGSDQSAGRPRPPGQGLSIRRQFLGCFQTQAK